MTSAWLSIYCGLCCVSRFFDTWPRLKPRNLHLRSLHMDVSFSLCPCCYFWFMSHQTQGRVAVKTLQLILCNMNLNVSSCFIFWLFHNGCRTVSLGLLSFLCTTFSLLTQMKYGTLRIACPHARCSTRSSLLASVCRLKNNWLLRQRGARRDSAAL